MRGFYQELQNRVGNFKESCVKIFISEPRGFIIESLILHLVLSYLTAKLRFPKVFKAYLIANLKETGDKVRNKLTLSPIPLCIYISHLVPPLFFFKKT